MKSLFALLACLLFMQLISVQNPFTLAIDHPANRLKLEARGGYLYGSMKNEWDQSTAVRRIPGSDTENFEIMVARENAADTIWLDENSFLHAAGPNLKSTFFRYFNTTVEPGQRIRFFTIVFDDIEAIIRSTPNFRRFRNAWMKTGKLAPGRYQVRFQWSLPTPLAPSNAVVITVPE